MDPECVAWLDTDDILIRPAKARIASKASIVIMVRVERELLFTSFIYTGFLNI